jgi:periplasmic protein TonB
LLSLVVDANGTPRDIHVVRQLGLGLDEKAIEAVMKWRFRPGMKGGRAVATQATVEVTFRLL